MSLAWTCEGCGNRLRGHWLHCVVCHLTAGGSQAFDAHLVSSVQGGCRTGEQLAGLVNKKTGEPRVVRAEIDGVTVWQSPARGLVCAVGNRVSAASISDHEESVVVPELVGS